MDNFVYFNVAQNDYNRIKTVLESVMGKPKTEKIQHCIEALTFSDGKYSLCLRYYNTKKLLFQGNFENMSKIISDIEKETKLKPIERASLKKSINEEELERDMVVGFDESGKGETFGSMFLAGVKIEKKNLSYLKKMLNGKNIKKMDKSGIENIFNVIKGNFSYEIKQISVQEIDSMSLNILLDRGYIELINRISKEPNKEVMFIDDYGVGFELQSKLSELENAGLIFSVENDADLKYTASSLASLLARRMRLMEMERLSKENIIINPENGEKIFFSSGSASNSETEKYLTAYRKLYPFSDFPSFVRTKWGNVRALELNMPKKSPNLSFTCKYCNKKGHKICLYYNLKKLSTECFCPFCGKDIDVMELRGFFNNLDIIIDTSTIITRTISKDLNTSKYLERCNFIIPSMLYEELDSKQPDMKRGGEKEISELRNFQDKGMIKMIDFDSGDYREVQNDKKFLRVVRARNGVMLTKDRTLSIFSEMGDFVIEIIENKELYFKKAGI